MRLELRVYKNKSKWIVKLARFPDVLKLEKFATKKEAIKVMDEWRSELLEQGRRFSVKIRRASGAPHHSVGFDHDGSVVFQPDRKWYDTKLQLRFHNQYGDRTLFLEAEDWTFIEKLVIDMKEKNNWDCLITQHGEKVTSAILRNME